MITLDDAIKMMDSIAFGNFSTAWGIVKSRLNDLESENEIFRDLKDPIRELEARLEREQNLYHVGSSKWRSEKESIVKLVNDLIENLEYCLDQAEHVERSVRLPSVHSVLNQAKSKMRLENMK